MAGTTPRFGFNYFGGGTVGTINDNGQKFTSLDRLLFDRLLSQVEQHTHRYTPALSGLQTPLAITLLNSGGHLTSGYTYYYKFSTIDQNGNESLASPEVACTTPAPLPPPSMPGLSSVDGATGSLAPGFYYYAVTGLRGAEESVIGAAAMVNLIEGESVVQVDLPTYGAAESYRVWRMGSTDAGFTQIGIADSPAASFVDEGSVPADPCACDPGVAPPAFNTGISSLAVTLDLPAGFDLAGVQSWRIYRTTYAGIYGAASLVHNVVEREDEWDTTSPLLSSWTDMGDQLALGQPLATDKNMRFQQFVLDHAVDALPDPAPYQEYYPLIFQGKLYAKIGAAWTLIGGGGGGGGMAPVLTAPGGNRFLLRVDDAGVLTAEPTIFPGPPSIVLDLQEV